jgi:putative ABC transport system permease protein
MTRLRIFLSRLGEMLFRGAREDRIDSEIDHHIQLLADEIEAGGATPAEARLAARKQFGNVDAARMTHRDQRGFAWLDTLAQDVRFAFRILTRERGFALTATVVLGVGLGVNNMFFTLVYAHKFRGPSIAGADRILSISASDDRLPRRSISLAEFQEMRDTLTMFAVLSAHASAPVTVGDEGRAPDRFEGGYVTAGAFASLGIAPLMGAWPSAAHDRPGAPAVLALGETAWQTRYGGDRNILGRTVLINGSPATVTAIVPDRSGFPSTAGVWMPIGQWPGMQQGRDTRALQVFGRLRDAATETAARTEVEALFGRLETTRPETNRNVRGRVESLQLMMFGTLEGWEPFITAGIIVILVASANVANLMMARSMHRSPEIAIRTSLGASRSRVVRQLLVEAAVIAAAGGVFGAVFARAGVALFQSALPEGALPYWIHYQLDARVFGLLLLVATASIAVFGLIPSLQASRTDVNRVLKDGGRSSTGHARSGLWTAGFLTVELALAMIMLTQVAIATLRANDSIPTDAVIHTTAVMTTAVTLPAAAYPTAERRTDFFRRLHDRLAARPEIVATSRASLLPSEGGGGLRRVDVEGRAAAEGQEARTYQIVDVGPAYFASLALPPIKGREFSETDGTRGNDTAIVNERFVEVAMQGLEPIGARIAISAPDASRAAAVQWRTIVGVTPTVSQRGPQPPPVVYLPMASAQPATAVLMVRHALAPQAVAELLREEVRAVDPNVPLYRMRTLARAIDDANWNGRVSSYMAGTVCILSLLLALVGLYAVTSQRVALKTQEIGLRMALGAQPGQVARLVMRGLRVPLVLGLLLGTSGAVAWDRAFSSGARDLYASAPTTLLTIGALLLGTVTVSCFIPLWRATRMNPVTALRHD